MAVHLDRRCDVIRDGTRCRSEATLTADAHIDGTRFRSDVCVDCRGTLTAGFVALGFAPTKATVGHSERGAYVASSGRTFTAAEARTWLREQGFEVPSVGKLSDEHLRSYAACH